MVAINKHYDKEQREMGRTKQKKFTPIGNMLVIEEIKHSGILDSGLAVAGEIKAIVTPRAWVVAAGQECKWVKEGDQVLIHGGSEILRTFFDGDELDHIREDRIAGIVDEKYR